MSELWHCDDPIEELDGFEGDVPAWIDQDITPYTVAAIVQGGCDSGAYMPAVRYHQAAQTMADYGDEVLTYLESYGGYLPQLTSDDSWSGFACKVLSAAVELWARSVESELEDYLEQTTDVSE